jgi:hypothetical protein
LSGAADTGAGGGGAAEEGRGRADAPRTPSGRRRHEPDERARAGDARPAACELCGGPVLERHCRIICLNCGFQRDCSDP